MMQWIFLLGAYVIPSVHLTSVFVRKTFSSPSGTVRIIHYDKKSEDLNLTTFKVVRSYGEDWYEKQYTDLGAPNTIEVYNHDGALMQLDYLVVIWQTQEYVFHCDCLIEPNTTKNIPPENHVIVRSYSHRPKIHLKMSVNITGTNGMTGVTKRHFLYYGVLVIAYIPLHDDVINPYQIDLYTSIAGDWSLEHIRIIHSYGTSTFTCYCDIREGEKQILPGEKAVVVRHSGTFNHVAFKISGTNGTTIKTHHWPGYWSYSTTFIPLNMDMNFGYPFRVDVNKTGTDIWDLDFVEVWIEQKKYRFDCQCSLNGHSTFLGVSLVSIVTICPNTSRQLTCNGGGLDVIDIIKGLTGRWDNSSCHNALEDSSSCNVTTLNGRDFNTCQGKQECILQYPEVLLQSDTCSNRYAMIVFTCRESVQTTSMTTITMQTTSATNTPVSTTLETTTDAAISANVATSTTTTSTGNNELDADQSFCCENLTYCNCFCAPSFYGDSGCSLEDVDCVVSAIREQLIVNLETTSLFKRKKISAYDGRTSSRMIGATGVVLLVTAALVIVVPDFVTLLNFLRTEL